MLYLIVNIDGSMEKTAELTYDLLVECMEEYVDIIRPNIFGDEVISYERLNYGGEWELIR